MVARRSPPGKKYFTPAQANAMLPLVRQIVKDITDLAVELRERHQRLLRLRAASETMPEAHREELDHVEGAFEQGQERMEELEQELRDLGVELKDYFRGLIDFPCWMDDHEVYLCWLLGEPEVAHWHEIDAGFAGRQKLYQETRLA